MTDDNSEFARKIEDLYRENGLEVPSLYRALISKSVFDLGTWRLEDDITQIEQYAEWYNHIHPNRRILVFADSKDLLVSAAFVVEDERFEPGNIVMLHSNRTDEPSGTVALGFYPSIDEWAVEVFGELVWWLDRRFGYDWRRT